MFVPGNNPGMMADAHIYGPDSIMLDLEDSVTMVEKDAARLLVHNALKSIDFGGTEMVVRINPRQIEVVNEVFAPSQKDIDKALRIIAAIKDAQARGSGVIALNGKMVDRPVVIRAERTIALAIASGILDKEEAL